MRLRHKITSSMANHELYEREARPEIVHYIDDPAINNQGVMPRTFSRILSIFLYGIPFIFFSLVYFLQTVSNEDIHQGAGQPLNMIGDAMAAFNWNARLGDMYAWPVINLFDYTYSFGIDTIFRLVDVALAVGLFYLVAYFILARKPKLQVADALVFNLAFLVILLSPYSRSLISGFSQIHNYLPMACLALLFALPYLNKLRGVKLAQTWRPKIGMLVIGFLFGFSANIPPIACLIILVTISFYNLRKLGGPSYLWQYIRQLGWEVYGVLGLFGAFFVMYVIGPGVSSYTSAEYSSSYVALGSIFNDPATALASIVGNIIGNIQIVLPVLIPLTIVFLVERSTTIKKLTKTPDDYGSKLMSIIYAFFILNLAALSQIDMSEVTRLFIPAYIAAIIGIMFTMIRLITQIGPSIRQLLAVGVALILVSGLFTVDISIGLSEHRSQASAVLNAIRDSKDSTVCVNPSDNPTARSPLLHYYQHELFVDWVMPMTIYGKQVIWC